MERKVTVVYLGLAAVCLILSVFTVRLQNKDYDLGGQETVRQMENLNVEEKADGTKTYQIPLRKRMWMIKYWHF